MWCEPDWHRFCQSIHSAFFLFIPFFKSSWWKMASAANNFIQFCPQTAATTFVFSSVWFLFHVGNTLVLYIGSLPCWRPCRRRCGESEWSPAGPGTSPAPPGSLWLVAHGSPLPSDSKLLDGSILPHTKRQSGLQNVVIHIMHNVHIFPRSSKTLHNFYKTKRWLAIKWRWRFYFL